MKMEARNALDELVIGMHAGRLTRRSFLTRAAQIGISGGTALSLLESCASSPVSTPLINLVWQSEFDITMTYQNLVNKFNRTHSGEIHVTLRSTQSGTNDLTVLERNMFRANNASVDLFSLDTIAVAEFAHNKWLTPISERQWPKSERAKYLDQPMGTCTYQGQVWAAPYRTDVGLIYYRTDLVDTPPQTWAELASTAFNALKNANDTLKYGYVWQAAQYEGLICDFIEVLYGNGGAIFDPNDEYHVIINSPAAADALSMMVGWVGTLSPADVTTYTEEVARQVWESGQAVFMRNWPYVYADAKQSPLATKFGVLPIMHGSGSSAGHSAIGGWQLAINNNIAQDRKEAAWTFIRYMLSYDAQLAGAQNASWAVTLKSIYDNLQLENSQPIFRLLREKNILSTAQARPKLPQYDQISQAIRTWIRLALLKQNTVKDVLASLSNNLTNIINQS